MFVHFRGWFGNLLLLVWFMQFLYFQTSRNTQEIEQTKRKINKNKINKNQIIE